MSEKNSRSPKNMSDIQLSASEHLSAVIQQQDSLSQPLIDPEEIPDKNFHDEIQSPIDFEKNITGVEKRSRQEEERIMTPENLTPTVANLKIFFFY